MDGARRHEGWFDSAAAGRAVEYRAITPPGWPGDGAWPLVLVLHGAGSSAATLDDKVDEWSARWSAGAFPPAVVAAASTPTSGGYYLDRPDGAPGWEFVVAEELPAFLVREFAVDAGRVALLGMSMGGYGALKLAFRHPERYVAVAALEPTVFPGETLADVRPRHVLGELAGLRRAMAGEAEDEGVYRRNHVVARLRANAAAVRASGLAILFDCGDEDCFQLQDGAEYLHRVLWDLDIGHDYHLVRGADHVGPHTAGRVRAAQDFLAAALTDARASSDPAADGAVARFRRWQAGGASGSPPAIDLDSPAGPAVLRLVLESDRQDAVRLDPTTARRFGPLPPTPAPGSEGESPAASAPLCPE